MRASKRAVPVKLMRCEPDKDEEEKWNNGDVDPVVFSSILRGMWCRLPECVQSQIQAHLDFAPIIDVDGYTIARAVAETVDQSVLKSIRSITYSCNLITYEARRLWLAKYYAEHAHLLRTDQKDLLAGCIAHMCPKEDRYVANADRVIGSAIACGGDFDAFQFFYELLKSSVKMNSSLS